MTERLAVHEQPSAEEEGGGNVSKQGDGACCIAANTVKH